MITAVIGAGFGDEGKGHITDYLVSEAPSTTLVVRYNGGAQAGHTVVAENVRHVFGHFGSGTLLGAPTFLSRHFIVNPMIWRREWTELRKLGIVPKLYIDPRALLTTPYDMLANQVLAEYGTCGLGIHETIVRKPVTTVGTRDMNEYCAAIRDQTKARLARRLTIEQEGWLSSDEILNRYLEDLAALRMNCEFKTRIPEYEHIIFEGAQGLLLDEDYKFFPFVTHSKTGLPNVLELCSEIGAESINAVYVTRSYLTRHGAGPLPTEDVSLHFEDRTNEPNRFQGSLRFGHLDSRTLASEIENDLRHAHEIKVTPSLAVTCLDQRPWPEEWGSSALPPIAFTSFGPNRTNVKRVQKEP